MIADRGKFYITITLVFGLLVIIGITSAVGGDPSPAYAMLTFVAGYVFANGKQLVAPFQPSPMIEPHPDKVRQLAEAEAAKRDAAEAADHDHDHEPEPEVAA